MSGIKGSKVRSAMTLLLPLQKGLPYSPDVGSGSTMVSVLPRIHLPSVDGSPSLYSSARSPRTLVLSLVMQRGLFEQ